jgi:integrase
LILKGNRGKVDPDLVPRSFAVEKSNSIEKGSMTRKGGLSYQMMNALKAVFRPGGSRYHDKLAGRDQDIIRGIGTMRNMVADVHAFSRFVRATYPDVRDLEEIEPQMAQEYIHELVRLERSGGRIGRVTASLRKLDRACRITRIFAEDAPMLLPYQGKGSVRGFHSQPRSVPYSDKDAEKIISWISTIDPLSAQVLTVMRRIGLRVTEAVYLQERNIRIDGAVPTVWLMSNTNRTKGGRARQITLQPDDLPFLQQLKEKAQKTATGHLFRDRSSLPDRVRNQVKDVCEDLHIHCLGTHGFRKTFAVENYQRARAAGENDREALEHTSQQLGHNRIEVAIQSYISADARPVDDPKHKEENEA